MPSAASSLAPWLASAAGMPCTVGPRTGARRLVARSARTAAA